MWFDNQFEKAFRRLSDPFFTTDDIFEFPNDSKIQTFGPYYYGYEMTVGPNGKPHVKEWGNVKPRSSLTELDVREPFVDESVDEKSRTLKLITEMPGIEKSDINVSIVEGVVEISAKHGDRKYSTKIPLKYNVDENSAKAQYTNGILELTLALAEEKPKGKRVSVE
ncbi:MAG: archaeal heat shock protein Hsp20 [Nitrosarchaeum sp.]|jgi:HSP20 family protein|uniref:archaeal heat shock protein Hsp20 n=1 Tax=Nitrosarchaeum sp. TaxID=2026886 RepID=UPI002DECA68C|nr:archaeal heat shock protein Hsp20 [Nitrosarchaeum sp.]MEC4848098.1 archaeal heat shock protein Hsp20 [Nitrosarchaeum sp.]